MSCFPASDETTPLEDPTQNDAFIKSHLSCTRDTQVSKIEGGFAMTLEKLQCLEGQKWLNDDVINFYLHLIVENNKHYINLPKVYAFGTHFSPKLEAAVVWQTGPKK